MGIALRGVSVTVSTPTQATTGTGQSASPVYDPFGAPVAVAPNSVTVKNVIVDNPTTDDIDQTTREHGVTCDLVLHFPKAHHEPLRGCSVTLPAPWGATFEVIGDPMPYDPGLTPGAHDRKVPVRRVVG